MCTVSWFQTKKGYRLFFNRDEQRSRLAAQFPQVFSRQGIQFISPIDGDAGGTWLGVNQSGTCLALLNHYEYQGNKTSATRSRGRLVLDLIIEETPELAISDLDLSCYQAFKLLVINPNKQPLLFTWNGKQLSQDNAYSPLSSSSFDSEAVVSSRLSQWHACKNDQALPFEQHNSYHASHSPEASAYSVCMHRPDAKTVSFSHLNVEDRTISFSYADGSPCSTHLSPPVCIARICQQEQEVA